MNNWQRCLEKLTRYLCPPGDGVFTVHTAQDKKNSYQQKIFKATGSAVKALWLQQLEKLAENNKPLLLGICSDTGGGILRGANWGPLFVREALMQYADIDYFDLGDIRIIPHLLHDKYLNRHTIEHCRDILYGEHKQKHPVSPLSITEAVVAELYKCFPDKRLFSIGGDHSVSYALLKAFLQAKQKQKKNVGLLHFDAHTDLLTERLGIDINFGSWAYHILNQLSSPQNLVQVGIRASGKDKNYWQTHLGVQQFWANDVHQQGAEKIAERIIQHYQKLNIDELYISFDIDALDKQYASATGTPETGGLSPDQAITIINLIAAKFKISGADLMEVAPFIQPLDIHDAPEPEMTLASAGSVGRALLKSM